MQQKDVNESPKQDPCTAPQSALACRRCVWKCCPFHCVQSDQYIIVVEKTYAIISYCCLACPSRVRFVSRQYIRNCTPYALFTLQFFLLLHAKCLANVYILMHLWAAASHACTAIYIYTFWECLIMRTLSPCASIRWLPTLHSFLPLMPGAACCPLTGRMISQVHSVWDTRFDLHSGWHRCVLCVWLLIIISMSGGTGKRTDARTHACDINKIFIDKLPQLDWCCFVLICGRSS